ncbi:hypothetical protein AB0I81_51615 [Nonomuraea sp. NPDC050404]|uniref:hypothetical protein n=1 Tax=Nonomuraea sp. NPDC050404 TaxID=3155783 RepID=UPI00340D4153
MYQAPDQAGKLAVVTGANSGTGQAAATKPAAARVVTMSGGMAARGQIDFDDLNWRRGYDPIRAYGRSKPADLLLGRHLARLAAERGWPLPSAGAHPGNAATNIAAAGPSSPGSSRRGGT